MATEFIRFASPRIDCDSQRDQGIFQIAYDLKYSGELDDEQIDYLDELLDAYSKLPVPDCYHDRTIHVQRRKSAICWFKQDARQFIRDMWTVAWFLKEHGVYLRLLRTKLPGRVLYEDKYQVCAVPFRRAIERKKAI